jgi:outer membrane lipoprotein-sorting protein
MKTKLFTTLSILLFINQLGFSQDTKAKEILAKLSNQTKTYKSYKVDFSFTIENKDQKIKETKTGELTVKGDKYRVNINNEQEVFSDGKKITTYMKEVNEAQVNSVDDMEEDALNPQNILTIYENGFKYKFNKELVRNGKKVNQIDLYPTNPKDKDYTIIRLFVDIAKNQITEAEILGKNGTVYTYIVKSLQPNIEVADKLFIFDKSKYPGVMIIE